MTDNIAFIDLAAQQKHLKADIDEAIATVLAHGKYIMGPEVAQFEQEAAAFCGAKHGIGCANGTDALQLALMALNVGPGDAVFVPSFTFASTAEVVPSLGATPFFVDCQDDTFNIDPENLKVAIADAKAAGLNPAVVIPVDLFGLPADYDAIEAISAENGMKIICDSAQGFGATYKGRITGSIGDLTTTSFFPAKPLGCYGDGGAIFTNDDDLAAMIRSLRVHGKGTDKYDNVRIGMNSRLDTLQAAILRPKLAAYAEEIEARNRIASRYNSGLAGLKLTTPHTPNECRSVWAQYTVKLEDGLTQADMQAALKEKGVPSVVYYPLPLHQQTAYADCPSVSTGLPNSESLSKRVLSLPMHPYMDEATQDRVIEAVRSAAA
ncbi:MAG: DegT/DnrJ/EryC1/StrS aminotransferase family protein [Pseudomonadota bacterium]